MRDLPTILRDMGTRITMLERNQNRVLPRAGEVTNWNDAKRPGQFWSKGVAGGPTSGWWIGTVSVQEADGRVIQRLQEANGGNYDVVWTRYFNGGSWSAWTTGQNRVLWTGSVYMNANQTIQLAEPISQQLSGITLVWQAYVNGAAQPYDVNYSHVPKWHVAQLPDSGVRSVIWPSTTATAPFNKYLYVSDTSIRGHANNSIAPAVSHVLTAVLGY